MSDQTNITIRGESVSGGGEVTPFRQESKSFDTRLGQLEVKLDSVDQKVEGQLEIRKWIFIAAISAAGVIITTLVFSFNVLNESLKQSRSLQEGYYKSLVEARGDLERRTDLMRAEMASFIKDNQQSNNLQRNSKR